MEITLEAILSAIGLLTGGGFGTFFTWRWMKRKARADAMAAEAEAKQKEAEAKAAEVEIAQKVQDTYQQMLEDKNKEADDHKRIIDELRQDRDYYKNECDGLRRDMEKLTKQFLEFKMDNEQKILEMKRDIARNGRMVECMRPFLCGIAAECRNRVPVTISATGEVEKTIRPETKKRKNEIDPYNED